MAEESIRRTNQRSNSTSSSSDRDVDPDYTVEFPEGRRDTASTSTGRAKRQCTIRNNENTQEGNEDEQDCHIVERSMRERKRSSFTRTGRNKHSEDEKKKKATILSWLIDSKTIEEDEEIFCIDEDNRIIKDGIIKREGIQCSCCQQIFTSDNFVIHGGSTITNKSWDRIFTPKHQVSLLSVMITAWNKPEDCNRRSFNNIEITSNTGDKYDDACVICADGGKLMCCEECNSTYHGYCLDLKVVPRGSWYCPYCVCRFCGDPIRGSDYLLKCPQCEKKYHWGCHLGEDPKTIDLNNVPSAPFCERSCKEVHDNLRSMIGVKNDLDDDFSWSLLRCTDNDSDIYLDDPYTRAVCHSKLAVAQKLMEDCFEQIIDRHTEVDVISGVLYNCGSNFTRIDFKGFYTAVLEKDEEIVSVATLRIHGTNLAEMPFIATSDLHRCKGMCKKLMVAIESALCYLNVEKLVISSTSEMVNNWIEKYGFCHLDYAMNKEIIRRNTLMFHDSKRLYKTLVVSHSTNPGRSASKTSWTKPRTSRNHHFPIFAQKTSIASLFEMAFPQQPE